MKLYFTANFLHNYEGVPLIVQKAFQKQSRLLANNIRHPSLHAKKYDESRGIWQARINRNWRFYFTISGNTYFLHDIIPHPK